MNKLDKKYQDLLQDILDNGVEKKDRTGTGTISVFGRQIRHKMSEGFPLLTTKKMPFKTIVTELLWFLRGDTNIKFLVDNNCHIWDGDAYKRYLIHTIEGVKNGFDRIKGHLDDCLVEFDGSYEHFSNPSFQYGYRPHTQEEFINKIKTDNEFAKKWGELGPIYGKQWRKWGERKHDSISNEYFIGIDQIQNLINDLKTNPDSRRLMVNAWNVGELDQMVLPPCHYGFQVYTRELSEGERIELLNKAGGGRQQTLGVNSRVYNPEFEMYNIPTRAISLMWNQRSCDFPLGIPFNIASYGLLLEIIAKEVNMVPDELIGNLGDCHIYLNQIEGCKEQIGRKYTHEERTELLKQAMGEENYNKAVDELMPFGGGLSEYYDSYKIPYTTREPYKLPRLKFSPCPITGIDMEYQSIAQFQIENYESHPTIKYPLSN
jgi:thymidylate synthase